MMMSNWLIVSCVHFIAISYVTSDIAKSSHIPLSYRSLDSNDYNGGMDYQMYDDRFPRVDDEMLNLTDQLSSNYEYVLPKEHTIPIRITGDAVDIPLAKLAEGLDKDFNFENSYQPPESTDEIRNFVKINTPPEVYQKIFGSTKEMSAEVLNNTTSKTASIKTTTTAATPTKKEKPTTQKSKIEGKQPSTKLKDVDIKKPPKDVPSDTKLTPKKAVKETGRSLYKGDDAINSKVTNNGIEIDGKYLQTDNFEGYQQKLIEEKPNDDQLQKIDELTQVEGTYGDVKTYEGWLPDGTPIQCRKSVVPFLNCKLEMFHVGELPFFYYGLVLLNSNLADKVCPCPMPRLDPDCVNTAHRVARYMEHICHAYLRM